MAKTNSQDFYVKIYLDEFNASDYLVEQYGYEVAYKFLKAKANLYFNDEDTCPDNPIAIGFWVSGVKRRTIADREHRQHISQVRADIRKKDKDNNCNNCNQMEQLITIDNNCNNCNQMEQLITNDNNCNNCNQMEQLITNDTINRVNRETELIEEREKNNNSSSGGQAPCADVPKRNTVDKPSSIDDVLQYAEWLSSQEKLSGRPNRFYGDNLKVYADDFFDYWESAGWRRKGGLMKDWRASFRSWCSNELTKARRREEYHQTDAQKYILSKNVDCSDAYNSPDPFGDVLQQERAKRAMQNQN